MAILAYPPSAADRSSRRSACGRRSRSLLSCSALPIALLIGLPLGCAAVITRNRRWRGLFHVHCHCRRCCSGVMERTAADSAVLARLGTAGAVPLAGFSERWLEAIAGRAMASLRASGIGHRYHRRCGDHALYACRSWAMPPQSQAVSMAMACGMTRKQALLRVGVATVDCRSWCRLSD